MQERIPMYGVFRAEASEKRIRISKDGGVQQTVQTEDVA